MSQLIAHAIDLKNTSDDAISSYLTTLPQPYTFSRVYTKTDVHLVLGYSAVAIAGATFYADRMLGWDATVAPWVIIAVIAYFILNSILSYWIWAVEAGEVFQGRRKTGETVRLLV
jgi:signal peptidase subunit SPC25